MSAQHVGLAVLIHRALAAVHDGDMDLAKGSLYEAMDLFRDPRIANDEVVQYAEAKFEEINQVPGEHRLSVWLVKNIIDDWNKYKPTKKL